MYSPSLHVFNVLCIRTLHIPVQAKRAELQDEMTVLLVAAPNGFLSSVISMELQVISWYLKGMMCFDVLSLAVLAVVFLENCSATTLKN